MQELAKTLILFPSLTKWQEFVDTAKGPLTGIYPFFDGLIAVIEDFARERKAVPDARVLRQILLAANDTDVLAYVDHLISDSSVGTYPEDQDFSAALDQIKSQMIVGLMTSSFQAWQSSLGNKGGLYTRNLRTSAVDLIAQLNQALHRLRQSDASVALRMHGEEAYQRMLDDYERTEKKREAGEAPCYTLPYKYFREVEIYRGDMITLWGHTSQCKSVLAREIAYDMLIREGQNIVMFSTEMPGRDVEKLFGVRHANNKQLFPGTPKIPFKDYRNSTLTPEQKDFYFDVAYKDFLDKDHYGTLQVEQPGTNFNLGDLADRCASVERTFMPIDVVVVDYLSQINPLAHGAKSRGDNRADVNRMFAEFRQWGLDYKRNGADAPMTLITPAQISRGKYIEALKNDKMYDISAASDFNEIERSSTIVLTTLMDPQMREEGRLRIQCLKNRMGAVPVAPHELYVALKNGMSISEFEDPDEDDFADRLAELSNLRYLEVTH